MYGHVNIGLRAYSIHDIFVHRIYLDIRWARDYWRTVSLRAYFTQRLRVELKRKCKFLEVSSSALQSGEIHSAAAFTPRKHSCTKYLGEWTDL
jgi:hypothetical protein